MRRIAGFIALVVCLTAPTPFADAQNSPATITGTAPFSLGMATAEAVAADPTLAPIATTACGAPASSASYGTRVTAPIAGYPYVATATLCFSGGKLGAIYLTWPRGTFQEDVVRWRLATYALAGRLAASYGPGLVRRYAVDDDMGGVLEIADGQGNLLTMTSKPGDDPYITVTYMSAAYDQAVNGKRITLTSY